MKGPPDPNPRVMPGEKIQSTTNVVPVEWVKVPGKPFERNIITGHLRTVLPLPK